MKKAFVASSVAVVAAQNPSIDQIVKQMNLKQNAKEMFGGMKIDMSKFNANSGELAKELGFENGFNFQEMDGAAHDFANTFGMGGMLDSVENGFKQKFQNADGSVMQQGQEIWKHMQQKAGSQGLGAAMKDGMAEAMQASQANPALRDTLAPMKDTFAHYKRDGMRGLVADAAHNPVIENALESNGFHVNDLLTKLGGGDATGKKGLENLMDQHRQQVEADFDANNSHFSYFFSFVIFVVLCAIAVALYEIYELQNKKKKPSPQVCENMV